MLNRLPFFRKQQKAIDLLTVRALMEDNITSKRMIEGVENQFKRFNDPSFAAKEVRERFRSFHTQK